MTKVVIVHSSCVHCPHAAGLEVDQGGVVAQHPSRALGTAGPGSISTPRANPPAERPTLCFLEYQLQVGKVAIHVALIHASYHGVGQLAEEAAHRLS